MASASAARVRTAPTTPQCSSLPTKVHDVSRVADRPLGKDESVTIEQEKLQQLCLYQLVLGYNLREKEAKGDAQDIIGR